MAELGGQMAVGKFAIAWTERGSGVRAPGLSW
jgi:hypothetical protein